MTHVCFWTWFQMVGDWLLHCRDWRRLSMECKTRLPIYRTWSAMCGCSKWMSLCLRKRWRCSPRSRLQCPFRYVGTVGVHDDDDWMWMYIVEEWSFWCGAPSLSRSRVCDCNSLCLLSVFFVGLLLLSPSPSPVVCWYEGTGEVLQCRRRIYSLIFHCNYCHFYWSLPVLFFSCCDLDFLYALIWSFHIHFKDDERSEWWLCLINICALLCWECDYIFTFF